MLASEIHHRRRCWQRQLIYDETFQEHTGFHSYPKAAGSFTTFVVEALAYLGLP
jgi:hypothetical protein